MSTVFVADARGSILERLAASWIKYARGLDHAQLLVTTETHPYRIRRAGEDAGMLHWAVSWAFAEWPGTARAAQTVMVHHLMESSAPALAALRFADAIVTTSERWRRRLADLTRRDIFLLPYTVDTTLFAPRAELADRRGRYVIGFSAKASSNEGGRKGIELFAEIAEDAATTWADVTILLIGKGWDAIAARLVARGVDVVHVVPRRSEETAALYPAMNVFLCTSEEEGGPCTILEAMACGVPVVTTDVGHVPEVVRDGETGFIVRERIAAHFLGRIRQLRGDAGLARELGLAARERMIREREESVIVPRIDFRAMHDAAREHFARTPRRELASRMHLAMRYVGNQLKQKVSSAGSRSALRRSPRRARR